MPVPRLSPDPRSIHVDVEFEGVPGLHGAHLKGGAPNHESQRHHGHEGVADREWSLDLLRWSRRYAATGPVFTPALFALDLWEFNAAQNLSK